MSYEFDLIVLLVVAGLASLYALWSMYQLDKVLRDPEHPYHDDYAEIIAESETRQTLDYWWR